MKTHLSNDHFVWRKGRFIIFRFFLVIILLFLLTNSVYSASISVTTANDSGTGSLRQAIADADDGDQIIFSSAFTIYLDTELSLGSKSLIINGLVGSNTVVIDGQSTCRIFRVVGTESKNITLQNLVIQNGKTTVIDTVNGQSGRLGGGILGDMSAGGTFYMEDCTVQGCKASSRDTTESVAYTRCYGGGIYLYSGSMSNCAIKNNTTDARGLGNEGTYTYSYGGGIYCAYSTLTGCTISGNNAESVADSPSSMHVINRGGGVYCHESTIDGCSVSGNNLKDDGSTYDNYDEYGGGIYNDNGTIRNSMITNNKIRVYSDNAFGGGIYSNGGSVIGCIISNNCTTDEYFGFENSYGGGIYIISGNISNCTIVNNSIKNSSRSGAGVYSENSTVINTIVWGNKKSSTKDQVDISGSSSFYYCAVEGGYSGTGNITLDASNTGSNEGTNYPAFVNPTNVVGIISSGYGTADKNPADWNIDNSSSCINKGTPNYDAENPEYPSFYDNANDYQILLSSSETIDLPESCINDSSRHIETTIDIGAYEINPVPIVSLNSVSDVTYNSAFITCAVICQSEYDVTVRGVCYSTSENPAISGSHTENGSGTGEYESALTDLDEGSTYYVRAYAVNFNGTFYSEQLTFTTSLSKPSVTTVSLSAITPTSASGGGKVTDEGASFVTQKGVCWSTSENPTLDDSYTSDGTGSGAFSSSLSGLTEETTYYVRAYAVNSYGTSYGDQISFTTIRGRATITTEKAVNCSCSTADCYAGITDQVEAEITSRGFCWSLNENPTITDNSIQNGSGIGALNSTITGLSEQTIYHVRAYATNIYGTAYGNDISFITLSASPGTALYFTGNGSGDYVNSSGITTDLNAVTIEAWVLHKTLPATIQRYITIGSENICIRHDGENQQGQLHFFIKYNGGSFYDLRMNDLLEEGKWFHVAATTDGITMKLYLNGELVGTKTPNGTLDNNNGAFKISSSGESMDGYIDEVRVWNPDLSLLVRCI